MPVIPKTNASQTVWLAKWEHKHGDDLAIHTTEEGARNQLVAWTRGALEEYDDWEHRYAELSDDALIQKWPEITGETEFLYVEDHVLHGPEVWDEVWDEAKDEPKKKTWKELFPESTLKPDAEGQLMLYTGVSGLSPEVIDKLRDGAPYFQELAWTAEGELIIHTGKVRDSIKTIDVFEVEKD